MPAPVTRTPLRGVALACATALSLIVTADARAATLHVAPSGSDTAAGSEHAPLATIGRAAALARRGDVVRVRAGRYAETVTLTKAVDGVVFRGLAGARIDGEQQRDFGFTSGTARLSDVTIEGFEIFNQGEAAISLRGSRLIVAGNDIHDVGADGRMHAYGVHLGYGTGPVIRENRIESIGPGGQATGVMLSTVQDAVVSRNEIRLVRKEGIRDSWGLRNELRDNAVSLCWTAIAFNTSTGSVATGNYLHDNVQGFNPKHVSEPRVIEYWGLTEPVVSRFNRNTVFRSSDSSVALAINTPIADHLEVRENVLSGAGGAIVADAPSARGDHVTLDANVYSGLGGRPTWLYHVGYDFGRNGLSALADLRSGLGWEAEGRWEEAVSPRTSGATPTAATLARPGAGAAAPVAETKAWTPLAMRPVASTSPDTWSTRHFLDKTADGVHHTYWTTETNRDEWVTYDFGRRERFDHLVLDVYSHDDNRNVRGYRFEVSDDQKTWRTILEGENPDAYGSSYKYELPAPADGRYLRFTLVDTFCADQAARSGCGAEFVLADLQAGRLEPVTPPSPPSAPPPSAPAPAPSAPAPAPSTPAPAPSASPSATSTVAAPTMMPAVAPIVPESGAPAPSPNLRVATRGVRRGRSVRLTVECAAQRCEGAVVLRSRGTKGRRAFAVAAGSHTVTVRMSRRPGRRLRAVVTATADGQVVRVVVARLRLGR